MTLTYEAEFLHGDIVYLKTDPNQQPRLVTRHVISGDNVQYEVAAESQIFIVQAVELSRDKEIVNFL
tara:strand:+ start:141 stop:341 length:201 start_codon:yes stop_codon:yes gene_type:complete